MSVYSEMERASSYIYVCKEYSIISSISSPEYLISRRFPRVSTLISPCCQDGQGERQLKQIGQRLTAFCVVTIQFIMIRNSCLHERNKRYIFKRVTNSEKSWYFFNAFILPQSWQFLQIFSLSPVAISRTFDISMMFASYLSLSHVIRFYPYSIWRLSYLSF